MTRAFRLALALTAVAVLLPPAPAQAGPIHRAMDALEAQMRPLEDQAIAGGFDAKAPERAAAMEAVFLELAASTSPYSQDSMWNAWLLESAAASRALEAAVSPVSPDTETARLALKRIAALREKAHAHFRPGLLGRLERWLIKRRFRHHETETPAVPVLPRPVLPMRPAGAGAP